MPRYRYIVNKGAGPDKKLSNCRLYAANCLCARDQCYIRVTVPDTVRLIKHYGNLYSETDSQIQIKDLNPVAIVRINGTARHMNGLWPEPIREWERLMARKGYDTDLHHGFVRRKEVQTW